MAAVIVQHQDRIASQGILSGILNELENLSEAEAERAVAGESGKVP
jgi:hypothetical protein